MESWRLIGEVVLAIVVLIIVARWVLVVSYGSCWTSAEMNLTSLKKGKNLISFGNCIEKVIFTKEPTSINKEYGSKCEISEKYNSYIVMIPNVKPSWFDYVKYALDPKKWIETWRRRRLKIKCIGTEFYISGWVGREDNIMLEGPNKRHCIFVEIDPIRKIKFVSSCD
jgi:hypothetical protein